MTLVDWTSASRFAGPWESPGFRLWHRFHDWQRRVNAALRPHDLTQLQFSVLAVVAWLGKEGDEVNQHAVAGFARLDAMLVSQVVRKLESKGLVDRRTSSADARARALVLTDEGVRRLTATLGVVEACDAVFFSDDPDPGAVRT